MGFLIHGPGRTAKLHVSVPVELYTVFSAPVELYTVFSGPETLVQNLVKYLVQNLAQNLVTS